MAGPYQVDGRGERFIVHGYGVDLHIAVELAQGGKHQFNRPMRHFTVGHRRLEFQIVAGLAMVFHGHFGEAQSIGVQRMATGAIYLDLALGAFYAIGFQVDIVREFQRGIFL